MASKKAAIHRVELEAIHSTADAISETMIGSANTVAAAAPALGMIVGVVLSRRQCPAGDIPSYYQEGSGGYAVDVKSGVIHANS